MGATPSDGLEVCWDMAWWIRQAGNEILAALSVFWEGPAGNPLRRAFQYLWFAFHVYQAAMHDLSRSRVAPHWRFLAAQEHTRRADSYVPSGSGDRPSGAQAETPATRSVSSPHLPSNRSGRASGRSSGRRS